MSNNKKIDEKIARISPHSMEAEEAVLGCMLINSESVPKTIQILNRKGYSVFKPLCISPVTREKGGFAIKSFRLIISGVLLLFSTLLTADDLYLFDDRFQPAFNMNTIELILPDTTENVEDDSIVFVNYPAKPMLYSLILPGLGQYNNGDPLWKSAIFAGVEVASIVRWVQWNKQAEDIRKEYELFGDTHWSLKSWVENTLLTPVAGLIQYDDFKLDGTHNLDLHLTGSLAETFGIIILKLNFFVIWSYPSKFFARTIEN